MLHREDYLYFTDRALAGMTAIVVELGDDRANRRAYAGSNTPYALLHHCLCVIQAWVGGLVRGRPIERDREAEFTAAGDVAALVRRCATVRRQMHTDVLAAEPAQFLPHEPPPEFLGPPTRLTQGSALQHVFEELAQHHGQMETLRDILVLAPARPAETP
jgi:cystathionine beta-lyase